MKNDINFCLFSMILKNLQVTIYRWIKTFFCSVANVGLTNLSRIFFGDSKGYNASSDTTSTQFFNASFSIGKRFRIQGDLVLFSTMIALFFCWMQLCAQSNAVILPHTLIYVALPQFDFVYIFLIFLAFLNK